MKKFKMIDEKFICENCGYEVDKLNYTARDHCPSCLYSKHVDIMPGDRASDCGGVMRPIRVEISSKKGYVIVHKCEKCGYESKNRTAHEAEIQPDDIKKIILLTKGEIR